MLTSGDDISHDPVERRISAIWAEFLDSRAFGIAIFVVAVLLAAFLSFKAVSNQITETNILTENRVNLARYLDGTAFRPFTYRLLTPVLVGIAQTVLHVPDLIRLMPAYVPQKLAVLCAVASTDPVPSCDSVMSYVAVAYACFFAFLVTMYCIVQRLFGRPVMSLLAVGFAFLAVNAVLLLKLSHIYDFGVLMLVSWMLLALDARRNILFTVILAIAYTNKETSILYAGVFFAVNFGRMPLRRNLGFFAAQLVLFVIIHGVIREHFAHNEGEGHEYYLPLQISFFTEHINLPMFLFMMFALVLVFYRFADKNRTLRRASIVMFPWFVLFMIGGVQRELRVMLEIFPLALLLATDSLGRFVLANPDARSPAALT
jgi:hypothetical protein